MDNVDRDAKCPERSNAAEKFLEMVRSRFPDTETLQYFDYCLLEYQAALLALLMSEELLEIPEADKGPNNHESRKDNSRQLTHIQKLIADSQAYEQYQQTLPTYLNRRIKLKMALKQLKDFTIHPLILNRP